jgi:hypothetical protein
MALYRLAIMGEPSEKQLSEVERYVSETLGPFGLRLGAEVTWSVQPATFDVHPKEPAAVAFFGAAGVSDTSAVEALNRGVPILPIASVASSIGAEIPASLKHLNCLTYADCGAGRIATALLECVGLLPRQRRVFVSYRRDHAREAALQVFNALSARVFDVFLDTHGIAPAEDFQAVLWHRLCDSDVLIMLDTEGYFDSRWTNAEYGRALAKGISILRVGWPNVAPSPRTATASRVDLAMDEVNLTTGHLSDAAVDRICLHVEAVRGISHAVRTLNIYSNLKQAIECIGGKINGVGLHNAVYLSLPDGQEIVGYPTVGVPTSITLNEAMDHAVGRSVAIIFDHIGLHRSWLEHLDWLGRNIQTARWIKVSEAAWSLAGWGVT